MALHCTCGAELPENARFCHNCGKPQREEDSARATPEPVAVAAETAAPAINFGNPTALRVCLLCASFSALLNSIPVVNFGCCLWLLGAGFGSAVLYSRRMRLALSSGDGARLGGITGLLGFVIGLAFTAVTLLLSRGGALRDALQQTFERMPAQDQVTRQLIEFFRTPVGLILVLGIYVVLGLIGSAALSAAGGALGARVMEKE